MPNGAEVELPGVLQWNRIIIYDPVPEWWLREADPQLQRQLMVVHLETMQKVLQVQAEGLAAAMNVLRQ